MNWFDIKQRFVHELEMLYPLVEIEAIFFIATEAYFKLNRMDYMLNKLDELSLDQEELLESTIARLKKYEPIQHIVCVADFYGREFVVNKNVLVPRQETELLIDLILKENKDSKKLLDIGTGSGCIPISLKAENPDFVIATMDVSPDAIEVAKKNAKKNDVELSFIHQDILDTSLWPNIDNETYDIIVSNPPYVLESEKELMSKNVVDFDPDLALYVDDESPLVFYEAIAKFASQKLKVGGKLYFEINERFGKEVAALCQLCGFSNVKTIKDLHEKDRFVSAIID